MSSPEFKDLKKYFDTILEKSSTFYVNLKKIPHPFYSAQHITFSLFF